MVGRLAVPLSWPVIVAVLCHACTGGVPANAMVPPAPRASPTKAEPYGFSFTPAGLAMTYHLGVAQGLLDAGLIDPTVPLAGASGGALAAFAVSLQPDAPGQMVAATAAAAAAHRQPRLPDTILPSLQGGSGWVQCSIRS
jgi:hypothetical protein